MPSLSTELKHCIKRRLDSASPEEILAITSTICAEERMSSAMQSVMSELPAAALEGFVKIGDDGEDVSREASDWVAVYDRATRLTWSRHPVPGGRMKWADAMRAPESFDLLGAKWRAPTIKELLTLVDYTRHDPAIDLDYFARESAWFWSSTPAAYSPSACAWGVNFASGNAYWGVQDGSGFVRAVRAGQ